MSRAVLFDFNGVLVDDEPIHFRLVREVLEGEGIDVERVLPEEDYWSHFVGLDDRACLLELLERAGEAADAGRIARLIA
ncbi:MAG: HAD family phosphatase, partial [Acidobacteriota bacterium]